MQGILKQKKIIITFFSIIISLIFFFFLFLKFGNFNKEINFDFTVNYDKIKISKGNIYLFNKTSLTRITNGKKIQKEISEYKNIDMQDDIVYVLFEKTLAMYSKNFDKIKEITLENKATDFFINSGKIILINNNSFTIYDETLNEIFKKDPSKSLVTLKFSKDNSNFVYTDYEKFDKSFKSRFHIAKLKEKKSIFDFTFFNEFIIDAGFINDSSENLYILTNEKLYLFEGNTIKNQIYVEKLKDLVYDNEKIYILSDDLQIYETKNLQLEKKLELSNNYNNMYILKNKILLIHNNGYSLIDKKNYKVEDFSIDILNVVKNKNEVYLILKNKCKKFE